MSDIGRVLTAMVTPFDSLGKVDYGQAKRLARALGSPPDSQYRRFPSQLDVQGELHDYTRKQRHRQIIIKPCWKEFNQRGCESAHNRDKRIEFHKRYENTNHKTGNTPF